MRLVQFHGWAWLVIVLVLLTACAAQPVTTTQAPASPQSTLTPLPPTSIPTSSVSTHVNLVDPQQPLAVAGQTGWEYQRTASADFDGDGTTKDAVLIAQVSLYNGRPAWEDGHVWQLYIEEADQTRTYLYAQFLPFGMLEARLSRPNGNEPPRIILVEQTPHKLGVYEIAYHGPHRSQASLLVQRELNDATGFSGTPNN